MPDHFPPPPVPGEPWSDELAHWYVENFGEFPTTDLAVEAAALSGAETVLDIGCGHGAAVRLAAARLSTGRAIGVDPSPAMIRIAAEQSEDHPARARIDFHENSAEHLPFADATMDVVIAIGSLHHWFDIPRGLSEVARVLRPAGRLVVVEDIFDDGTMGMSGDDIGRALQASGFTVTDIAVRRHAQGRATVAIAQPGECR